MPANNNPNAATDHAPAALFDPWVLWVTFRRCWPFALPTGAVLAGLVAFGVLKSFVPSYRASHLLEANQDFVVFKGVMPVVKNLAKTEKALFFNSIVLDPVLADPKYRSAPSLSDPQKAELNLISNLRVSSGGTESRLSVSYQDTDQEAAAMVCNAIVESYLRQRDAFDNTRVSNLERWLKPEIQRWEQQVWERQQIVQKLSQQTLGYAPGKQASQIENKHNLALATKLRSDIAELGLKISIGEAKLAMQANVREKRGIEEPTPRGSDGEIIELIEPAQSAIDKRVLDDPTVVASLQRLVRYKTKLIDIEDQDRIGLRRDEYRRFQAKAAEWKHAFEQAKAVADTRIREELTNVAQINYQNRLDLAKERLRQQSTKRMREHEELKSRLKVLQEQYAQERVRLEQFGGATAELQFAQEELSVASDVLHKLRDRVAAIRTERRQDGAVRSLAPAKPPRSPVESVPYKKLVTYCGAAMMLPFALGLIWEIRVQRLTDSSMCRKNGLTVIGEIAKLPSGSQLEKRRRLFQESVDTLRTSLFLSIETGHARSIAVVSGMTGEGKSSVASQLALSIAKATGETVLLVDADLRCPEQHEIFGLPMGPGLSSVLAEEASFEEAVDTSLGDLIHVLPAGPPNGNRYRLISPENIQRFMETSLEDYKYVVFDTAPILSAGETLAVAAAVDATLLCVMRDVSRTDNVNRATRRLEAVGATLAGTVFSGISAREYAYRYGDYYTMDSTKTIARAS